MKLYYKCKIICRYVLYVCMPHICMHSSTAPQETTVMCVPMCMPGQVPLGIWPLWLTSMPICIKNTYSIYTVCICMPHIYACISLQHHKRPQLCVYPCACLGKFLWESSIVTLNLIHNLIHSLCDPPYTWLCHYPFNGHARACEICLCFIKTLRTCRVCGPGTLHA